MNCAASQIAICHLINLGLVNCRQDPNGLVPSTGKMKSFAMWNGEQVLRGQMKSCSRESEEWRKERIRDYLGGPLVNALE